MSRHKCLYLLEICTILIILLNAMLSLEIAPAYGATFSSSLPEPDLSDTTYGLKLQASDNPTLTVVGAANVNLAEVGQIVTYTYWITNSGNVNLTAIKASDTGSGQIFLEQTLLAPGEEIISSRPYTITLSDLPGPLLNKVTVTGRPPAGSNITATTVTSLLLKQTTPVPGITRLHVPIIYNIPNTKKGIGATAHPACADLTALEAHWYLNWSHRPDRTCRADEADKFVPRIYNTESIQFLDEAVENAKASGWLMGFSEPNLPWQGDVSPAQGAVLWKQIEEAADVAGIKLVSPSPNQWEPNRDGLPHGHQWVWAMVNAYQARYGQKPRFDAIAWNIYKASPIEIKTYLTARHNEMLARGYDVPVWIIEYGGRCWNSGRHTGNEEIMTEITAWFEATPWIGRYAWFASRLNGSNYNAVNYQSCSLINVNNGELTPLGQIYIAY